MSVQDTLIVLPVDGTVQQFAVPVLLNNSIVQDIPTKRILVVNDSSADIFVKPDGNRLPASAPVSVTDTTGIKLPAGASQVFEVDHLYSDLGQYFFLSSFYFQGTNASGNVKIVWQKVTQ